ncbi:MAG: methylenetetrahydrofolate reductase [Oscillospiraceae bacterium]
MSVSDILETRNAFSFEVFPRRRTWAWRSCAARAACWRSSTRSNPDYISCTYGAGGTNVGKNLEVLKKIKADGKCTPVTHFTCVGQHQGRHQGPAPDLPGQRHRPHARARGATCPSAGPAPAATCTMPPSW